LSSPVNWLTSLSGKQPMRAPVSGKQPWYGKLLGLVCLLVVVGLMSGCGYRLTGSHATDTHSFGRTVWVDFIGNTSTSSTAQTVLRRALLEEFHSQRSLVPASSRETADLYVRGALRSYTTRAISYTANDLIREYRLTLEAELEVKANSALAPLWKGVLTASSDFPASDPQHPDLALQRNAEDAAQMAVARRLAQSLIFSLEESY